MRYRSHGDPADASPPPQHSEYDGDPWDQFRGSSSGAACPTRTHLSDLPKQAGNGRDGQHTEAGQRLRGEIRSRASKGSTMAPRGSPAIPPTRSGEQHGLRPALPPLDMSRRLGNTRASQGRSACECKWPAAAAPVRQRASSGTRAGSVSTGLSHGGQSPVGQAQSTHTHIRTHSQPV